MFQEEHHDDRRRRESLHSSFRPTNNLHDNNLEDRIRHHIRQRHPSRMPDTDDDDAVAPIPRRAPGSRQKNYAKRQSLIKRGRALIQRGRQQSNETDSDSFSVDDGSYKDDLRRSILEEEATRNKIEQRQKLREENYRQLKSDIMEHPEDERNPSSSTTSRDNTKPEHLPLNKKTERETPQTTSSTPRNTAHSTTTTVSSRIKMWEQGTSTSGTSTHSTTISGSSDARQRTEERLLYLKQFLKDRDAQSAAATNAAADADDVTDCISVQTPATIISEKKSTKSQHAQEAKQVSPAIPSHQNTGTIGISSGFPFPQNADIAIGMSVNISAMTTPNSLKEPGHLESLGAIPVPLGAPMLPSAPQSSQSQEQLKTLELTKSLDDMNQMLPGPKELSKPSTEQKSKASSNERKFKAPSPKESEPPAPKPTMTKSIPAAEEQQQIYISSSARRNSEPLRSLLDFDSLEESSLDQPAEILKADESFEQHTVAGIPIKGTYSKMSSLPSSSNSDGIRTIAQESRVGGAPNGGDDGARSIACPDSETLKESSKGEKPTLTCMGAMTQAMDHDTPIPQSPGKNDGNLPSEKANTLQVEGPSALVQPFPPIPKTKNQGIMEFKQPLETDQMMVEVSSTLTESIVGRKFPPPSQATPKLLRNYEGNKSTPSLRKSKNALVSPDGEESAAMSISYKDEASFDSMESIRETDERIWRLDPLDSLSDFILQIRNKETGKSSQYHVHKHRLACGPRKSTHLDKLFQERSTSSTHFSFCSKACEFFPSVLDFMYCDDYQLEFTTTDVVIYRGIGYQLQINSLVAATTRFVQEDIQVGNMTSYVSDMETHGNLGLRKIMTEKCATKIEHISELDSLWIIMDPDLFRAIVSCKLVDRTKNSQHLSILIAEYTALHKHEMSQWMFGKLTSSAIIPKIAREAALPLLEICFSYGSPREFEGLQKRCALTMATYWKITNENDRQRLFALLRNLPSSFTVDFLEKVDTGKMTSLLNFSMSQEYQNAGEEALGDDVEKDDTFDIDEDETEYMGWRLDPDLSYSDWVIRVKSGNNPSAEAYYVHKHILGVGKQKSAFFASVFSSSNRNQSIARGSTAVSLDQDAAKVFPRMLDYIYSKGRTLDICTQTIMPLRFLARTFQVYALNQAIVEFVQRDLCLDNVTQYLENADSFNDKGITGMVIDFIAANIEEVDIDSELLNELEPSIFRRVISSETIDRPASESYHVPILIAKYFYLHELDETLLEEILSSYDMEQLDCLNALKLLQIICRLEKRESFFFMTLRDKCTDVLADSWDDFRESFRNEVFAIMLTLDTETVAQIFDKVENRCYKKLETPEDTTPTAFVPTTDIAIPQNAKMESSEIEAHQERKRGHSTMPPATTTQFIKEKDHPENRQPESTGDRPPSHITVPSAPSEEMRNTTMLSAPSEEIRVGTMTAFQSKEMWVSTMGSSPSVDMFGDRNVEPSCQIFSCGFMASE